MAPGTDRETWGESPRCNEQPKASTADLVIGDKSQDEYHIKPIDPTIQRSTGSDFSLEPAFHRTHC